MKEIEPLEQALRALRDADAGRGASEFTETRLRAAFRERHARSRRRWWISPPVWAAASIAAVIVLVVSRLIAPASVQAPPAAAPETPQAMARAAPEVRPAAPAVPSRERRKSPRPRAPHGEPRPAVAARHRPALEEFIPIPWAPPFTAHDHGQVVRVRVPRQSLRSMGLPVNEERMFERIPADLLMGEDGVPRAIRFVNDRR
jgi:hypothetical protein